jgi:DNA invertase Pin-like site-specific DNA recombinase
VCSFNSVKGLSEAPFPLSLNTLIKMNTTAVIYARVSSIGDRQNTDRQISDLLDYVEYQKLELCKIFEEHISGAKKNVERPILQQAIEFCKSNGVSIFLVSELSRLGRNAFEVLATVKDLIDSGINLYLQKEQLTLLDAEGKPTMFAPIMIATLSTCAQLERENIKFRLNSGRKLYIERGGKLGRKVGSIKTTEQKRDEHRDIISYLKRGYSVRNVAKLTNKGISTVQRIKTEFDL